MDAKINQIQVDIGDLKKAIEDMPDDTRVLTTDETNKTWAVHRANIGVLQDGELVFVISRFVKEVESRD